MKNYGYRTEELYGEGYRNAANVMSHEVFELGNTDILDTLSETILKNTEYSEKLKTLSEVIAGSKEDEYWEEFCEEAFEDGNAGIKFFMEILNKIKELTGREIRYALWFCDSIEDIKEEYEKIENEHFTSFDVYEKSEIVLSDMGRCGRLYGYEENPKPYLNKEMKQFDTEEVYII